MCRAVLPACVGDVLPACVSDVLPACVGAVLPACVSAVLPRGGSRGGSLGSDEPPLLLTALKNKAY